MLIAQGSIADQSWSQNFNSSPSLSHYTTFLFSLSVRYRQAANSHGTKDQNYHFYSHITHQSEVVIRSTQSRATLLVQKGKGGRNIWQTELLTTSLTKVSAPQQNLRCGDSAFHGWDWLLHWHAWMGVQSSKQIKYTHSSHPQTSVDWVFHLLNVFEL